MDAGGSGTQSGDRLRDDDYYLCLYSVSYNPSNHRYFNRWFSQSAYATYIIKNI